MAELRYLGDTEREEEIMAAPGFFKKPCRFFVAKLSGDGRVSVL
jgi:hypothetical protein